MSMSGDGGVVGFPFYGPGSHVSPGSSSDSLVIQTNATAFGAGNVSLQDGSAGTGVGFAPKKVSAAPEPGSWALMLGGVALLGSMLRLERSRRRQGVLNLV